MDRRRHGFSLVELLVTIAVIAILTGISIPILRGVFDRRRDTERVSNIRLTMVDFLTYANDKDGVAPNIGIPGIDNSSPWYEGMTTPGDMMPAYLAITASWPLYLNAHFGESHRFWHPPPGPQLPDSLTEAGHTPDHYGAERMLTMPSDYRYSLNFVTTTSLWEGSHFNLNAEDALPFAIRVRFDQSEFPSAKGVLIHQPMLTTGRRVSVALVDGSAAMHAPEALLEAVPYPFGAGGAPFDPVLGTRLGYAGRDITNR